MRSGRIRFHVWYLDEVAKLVKSFGPGSRIAESLDDLRYEDFVACLAAGARNVSGLDSHVVQNVDKQIAQRRVVRFVIGHWPIFKRKIPTNDLRRFLNRQIDQEFLPLGSSGKNESHNLSLSSSLVAG